MGKAKNVCNVCSKRVAYNGGLFKTCNICRAKGCKHITTHYDSALNKVCSDCGTVLYRTRSWGLRTTDAEMEMVRKMLAEGKAIKTIQMKTQVITATILKIQDGTYKSVKNIVGCC